MTDIKAQIKSLFYRHHPEEETSLFEENSAKNSMVGLLKEEQEKGNALFGLTHMQLPRSGSRRSANYTYNHEEELRRLSTASYSSTYSDAEDLEPNSPMVQCEPELPIVHYKDLCYIPDILTRYPAFYVTGHNLGEPPFHLAKKLLTSPDREELRDPMRSTTRGYNEARVQGREWWDYNPREAMIAPPDDPEFERATKEYYDKSLKLLQDVARQFNIGGRDTVPQEIINEPGFSSMRYLRYSEDVLEQELRKKRRIQVVSLEQGYTLAAAAAKKDPEDKAREKLPSMEAHTDLGVFTMINSTEPSGLYVWNRRNKAFSAQPIPDTVLIIAGDLMPCFTAVKGKSPFFDGLSAVGERTVLPTAHTVWVPKGCGDRYSIAVFLRPKRNMTICERTIQRGSKDVVERIAFWWLGMEKMQVEGRKCFLIGGKDPQSDDEDSEEPQVAPLASNKLSKFSW
ncbi:hypothetical protein H072_6011 [Dactylellina haptotyla CBS 200.50]|uniref:Fe2OG dioxygenase domain-containing protein n=1 Tax=Dactylellina haptotyla (strain CBS 200.50) TaxID=1284197 RepID=S8AB88_DACHA|nr:hypothetical protein H072_6011 [Dactylellina haptotyla CBS 200.50]